MHVVRADRIEYDVSIDDNMLFEILYFVLEADQSSVFDTARWWQDTVWDSAYGTFDQWEKLLDRETENSYLQELDTNSIKHIASISTSETVEWFRQMYQVAGYFTDYPRKCVVDFAHTTLTFSLKIENLVYSSKDKNRLTWGHFPPIRSASDQRIILTGLRTWVVSGIQVTNTTAHLIEILLRDEILSPFELGRLLCFNFQERGLQGKVKRIRIRL